MTLTIQDLAISMLKCEQTKGQTIYQLNSEEIQRQCEDEWTIKDACTLLLSALAEIHSNAKSFGGINSSSFKIKWKQIDRRGKQICKHYFGEKS